jgi:hypothetical protein
MTTPLMLWLPVTMAKSRLSTKDYQTKQGCVHFLGELGELGDLYMTSNLRDRLTTWHDDPLPSQSRPGWG